MNKATLIDLTASILESEGHGTTKVQIERIMSANQRAIMMALAEDPEEKIQLIGFGTYKTSEMKERDAKDPRDTTKTIHIPASRRISFTAGSQFKDIVNGRKEVEIKEATEAVEVKAVKEATKAVEKKVAPKKKLKKRTK